MPAENQNQCILPCNLDQLALQLFTSRPAVWIKVRELTTRDSTHSRARSKLKVVGRRSMVCGSIIPYRQVVLAPTVSQLSCVVLCHQITDIALKHIALVRAHAHNVVEMVADAEHRLPACDGIRANEWVPRRKMRAHVQRTTGNCGAQQT